MDQGLLKPGSVHRIAIVGPGLDFVNKKSGSDFYPPQTTQPFAVIDSLARLGLADPATIDVYTFDISPRVNRHLERARKDATAGKGYTIQLLSSPSDHGARTTTPASSTTGRSWATRSASQAPEFRCPRLREISGTAPSACGPASCSGSLPST